MAVTLNEEELSALMVKLDDAQPCPRHGREGLAVCTLCEDVACELCDPTPCQCDNDD